MIKYGLITEISWNAYYVCERRTFKRILLLNHYWGRNFTSVSIMKNHLVFPKHALVTLSKSAWDTRIRKVRTYTIKYINFEEFNEVWIRTVMESL